MTVFPVRSSFSSTLGEKLFAYLFNKTANNYGISHATFYLSIYVKKPP